MARVTIETSADKVWPWIAQIRLAPYAYDWIDNLGRQSPRGLRGLDEPKVGESLSVSYDAWWAQLQPLLSDAARAVYVYDDPRNIPAMRITGVGGARKLDSFGGEK